VKIEALAQLGKMLESMEKNKGAVKGKTGSKGKPLLDTTPTLKELGIDKKTSMVAQHYSFQLKSQFISKG